jgi:hypothetical protein
VPSGRRTRRIPGCCFLFYAKRLGKRIPDDPAGLLKRKFKYQYGQRGRQSDENNDGW